MRFTAAPPEERANRSAPPSLVRKHSKKNRAHDFEVSDPSALCRPIPSDNVGKENPDMVTLIKAGVVLLGVKLILAAFWSLVAATAALQIGG